MPLTASSLPSKATPRERCRKHQLSTQVTYSAHKQLQISPITFTDVTSSVAGLFLFLFLFYFFSFFLISTFPSSKTVSKCSSKQNQIMLLIVARMFGYS